MQIDNARYYWTNEGIRFYEDNYSKANDSQLHSPNINLIKF